MAQLACLHKVGQGMFFGNRIKNIYLFFFLNYFEEAPESWKGIPGEGMIGQPCVTTMVLEQKALKATKKPNVK